MLPLLHFGQLIYLFSLTLPIPKMGSAPILKKKKKGRSLIINREYQNSLQLFCMLTNKYCVLSSWLSLMAQISTATEHMYVLGQ